MSELDLERRLADAFADVRATVHENPDLFERVNLSLDAARERRRFRLAVAARIAAFVAVLVMLGLSLSDFDNRRFTMRWWVMELLTDIVLVALAVGLGPFIKRFGRSYAADVFRANPRTGKSYLVLTDVADYLIFASFVLFTVTFVEPRSWLDATGAQLKHEVVRVGGILLIMGVLHAANVVALPVIGRLLTNNQGATAAGVDHGRADGVWMAPSATGPSLGPGTWIVRIEPSAPHTEPPSAPRTEPPAAAPTHA